MAESLPDNWRVAHEERGAEPDGHGMWGYALYRWGNYTTGHLLWKKRRQGWIFKQWNAFWTEQEAIDLAVKTERMLQS